MMRVVPASLVFLLAVPLLAGCTTQTTYSLRAPYTVDGATNGTVEVDAILDRYEYREALVQESWPPVLVVLGLTQPDCGFLSAELNATGHFQSVGPCRREGGGAGGTDPDEPVGHPAGWDA